MAESLERYLEFTRDQLKECVDLYVDVFNGEPWYDQWTTHTASKRLLDMLHTPGFFGVVAVHERVVGFAAGYREQWPDRTTFYLKELCVSTDLQGTGVGSRLLSHLENELLDRLGVGSVFLATRQGSQAEAFYLKNGYIVREGMVLMSRRIRP